MGHGRRLGTNGCHQGAPAARPAPLPPGHASGSGDAQAAREIPDPFATRGIRAPGRPGPVPAPSDRGTAWMPRVIAPPGGAPEPHDGMVRCGRRQPGAMIMSAGRAPRIASASIPATPAGPGQAGHDDRGCGRPGGGEGTRRRRGRRPAGPSASPIIHGHSRACSCGPSRAGPRPVPRPVSRQLGTIPIGIYVTSAMATTGVRQSRRAVPSRAGSAGVILRGWELITPPGCDQRPGQCEHCWSRSRSWTRPAHACTIRTSATA